MVFLLLLKKLLYNKEYLLEACENRILSRYNAFLYPNQQGYTPSLNGVYSLCFESKAEVTYSLSFVFLFQPPIISLFTARFTGTNIEATEAK